MNVSGRRFTLKRMLIAVGVIGGMLGLLCVAYRHATEPYRRNLAVAKLIRSLYDRRPADMTPAQWKCAVDWTCALHGNCQLAYVTDMSTVSALERRLKAKLAGDVDMQTIHWIWSEYAKIPPYGPRYQRHKAEMLEEIESLGKAAANSP